MSDFSGSGQGPTDETDPALERRQKLEAMAAQTASPKEAEVARRMLHELDAKRPPDTRSFSERYRAVPRGTPPRPGSVPPKPRVRRVSTGTRLLYWAGALLLVAAVVGGSVMGIVALTSTSTPTARPIPSAITRLAPSPTPTPGLPDDPAAVDRVAAFLSSTRHSYHVAISTTVVGQGHDGTVSGTALIGQLDWDGTLSVAARGATQTVRIIHAKDRFSYRVGSAAWRSGYPAVPDLPELDPLVFIDSGGDLVYGGPELLDGTWCHHVWTRQGWVLPSTTDSAGLFGQQLNSARMDLWVRADGTPIQATYAAEIGIVSSVTRTAYQVTTTYRFSHVGEKVSITAP